MQLIKQFKGHSGCDVNLVKTNNDYFVFKTGDNDKLKKSFDILTELQNKNFNVPNHTYSDGVLKMEYINGINMTEYIENIDNQKMQKFIDFVVYYVETLTTNKFYDYSDEISNKLNSISKAFDTTKLSFDLDELYNLLPKKLCKSLVHGDFTLDNIIYYNKNFFLIDTNPTDIDSLVYDLNKLRQDLDCYWFIRHLKNKTNHRIICDSISNTLKQKYDYLNNNHVLIFMLMRILPYCKDKFTENFLIKRINELWQ